MAILLATTLAWASPIADKREQAKRVKAQIDALDNALEPVTEDYNVALDAYQKLNGKVAAIRVRLGRVNSKTGVLQTSLNTRAESMYRSGPLGVLDVLLGTASFEDFAATWDFLNDQNKRESLTVAQLKQLRAETMQVESQLVAAQTEARNAYKTVSARKSDIESRLAQRKRLLRGVEKEIAALEAADRARRVAEARRYGGGGGGTGWDWGNPTRAPRSGVVAIAMKYLGCPYQWGASGPSRFDCSGFTMFVYAQVGVSLPHSSRAQIGCGQPVSRSNLEPGDLVFFGSPIHHVGMYIGGGRMIHAPHTGDVVSIDSIDRGNYAGACRP